MQLPCQSWPPATSTTSPHGWRTSDHEEATVLHRGCPCLRAFQLRLTRLMRGRLKPPARCVSGIGRACEPYKSVPILALYGPGRLQSPSCTSKWFFGVTCRLPSLSASNFSCGPQRHGQLWPTRSGLYPQLWHPPLPPLPHPRKPNVHCSIPNCSLVTAQHNRPMRLWTWTEPDLAGLAFSCSVMSAPFQPQSRLSLLVIVSGCCWP